MARLTGAQVYTKWSQRVAGAQPYYIEGINNAKDWAAAAIAAGPARDTALQQAMHEDRINRGIQRAGTAKWRDAAKGKGATNWAASVATQATQQAFMAGYQRLSAQLDAGDSAIANLPRGGFNANMQRALAYATAVHQTSQDQKRNG